MKFRLLIDTIRILPALLLFLVPAAAFSQNSNQLKINSINDSGNRNTTLLIDLQTDYLNRFYSEKIAAPKELINGKEYEPYYTRSKIKPLLYPGKARTASIITKTRRYNNLTLQYDTFLDEVVYTDTSRTLNYRFPQIALNKDIIEGFNLYFQDDSLIFRYFRSPEYSDKNLKEGFYEIAYTGKSSYVIKHESTFYEREGLNEYKYSPKNYISIGNKFYKIKTKRSLLHLFNDKTAEVKSFIHSSRIRMRQADKSQIAAIVRFYDSLETSKR
jgi:hypothetical protein